MANIQHSNITDPNIHEPKGASTANEGDIYTADGVGSGSWGQPTPAAGTVTQGAYKYSDTATVATPIELTLADTEYELTNDGLGTETFLDWPVPGLPNVWNTSTNRLVFSNDDVLSLGDNLDILVEVDVTTTSVNTAISVYLDLDPDGTPFRLNLLSEFNFKDAGTYPIDVFTPFFMKSTDILNGGGRLLIEADSTGAEVAVRGFFIRAFHTNA